MTQEQRGVVLDCLLGRSSEDAMRSAMGWTGGSLHPHLLVLLQDALSDEDAEAAELGIGLLNRFGASSEFLPVLQRLLRAPWHTRHEDIVGLFEALGDPRVVSSLFDMARSRFAYREWDDGRALERKCIFLIRKLGTPDAVARLIDLSRDADPFVVAEAVERLREVAERSPAPELRAAAAAALEGRRGR